MGLIGDIGLPAAGLALDGIMQAINAWIVWDANNRTVGRGEEATESAGNLQDEISVEQLLSGTGLDQPFSFGGRVIGGSPELDFFSSTVRANPNLDIGSFAAALDRQNIGPGSTAPGMGQRFLTFAEGGETAYAPSFEDQFTSADVFRSGVDFQPLDPEDFRFDPSEMQALGTRLGTDLRRGAVDFDTLLTQSNVEGLTERAAERFPDFDAFRTERLGGIADAAREAQRQAQQEISGRFSSLEEGQTELGRREFAGELSAGRSASAVENAVEALLGQKAVTLGGIEQAEALERGRLATSAATGARQRDLGAANIEALLFGRGEELEAGNLGLLADIERFNETTPIDIASRTAQFASQDQAQSFNAMMSIILPRLQASLAANNSDVTLEQLMAALSGITESLPQFSAGAFTNYALGGSGGGGGPKEGYSAFGFGYSCVDGACRIPTPYGSRRLVDIAIGDYVTAADGRFRKVVARDYGTVPKEHRARQLLIRTPQNWLSVTEDHPLGGRAARLWKPGDDIAVLGGRQRIVAVRTIPYRISGDLMLEGNGDYVANGFVVNSVIGKVGLERWRNFIAA